MPGKVPVSTRVSREDADYLADLNIEGAVTPSDKLRAIIKESRQRQRGTEDYPSSLRFVMETMAASLRIIRTSENAANMHSELLSRVGEWTSECFAYLLACNGAKTELDNQELKEIEAGLANRVFVLMESILQMGVTRHSACYNPQIIREGIQPVLDIASVVSQMKGGRQKKGKVLID